MENEQLELNFEKNLPPVRTIKVPDSLGNPQTVTKSEFSKMWKDYVKGFAPLVFGSEYYEKYEETKIWVMDCANSEFDRLWEIQNAGGSK